MKSSMIMIVTAVLLAAACAGIVLSDEESDAVAVGDIDVISYTDGKLSASIPILDETAATIGIATAETEAISNLDLENMDYWVSASGTQYAPGTTIAIETINAADVVNGVFTLNAHYKATTVAFVVDGKTVGEAEPAGEPLKITVPEDLVVDIAGEGFKYDKEGFKTIGWDYTGTPEVENYTTSTDIEGVTVEMGESFVLVYQELYSITWVVDNTQYVGSIDNISQPADPTKEHYTFIGWADASGKIVLLPGSELTDVSGITADVTYTAQFKAEAMSVTLMVDNVQWGSIIEVSYNNTINAPALPSGYAYWAIQTKAPVYGEDGTTIVEPAEYAEFDFATPITSDVILYAIEEDAPTPDESIYATFNIEGTIYGPYKVSDRFSIPQTDREGYDFLGWTVQGGDGTLLTSAQVQNYQYTEDVTFIANYVAVEPPAPEEPAFYETTTGQAAIVLIVFVIVLFVAAVYMNIGGLREKLFGWKITRKD